MLPMLRLSRSPGDVRLSVLLWVLRVAALAGVWLVLTDSRNTQELILGSAAVAITAVATSVIARTRPRDAWARLRAGARLALTHLPAALWRLCSESAVLAWRVAGAVVGRHSLGGRFRAAAYRPGGERRGVAGTVATELIGSLAPNRYVVGVDEDRGIVIIHELAFSHEPVDPMGG
jgi:Na+/H+ ion antiporter subunit